MTLNFKFLYHISTNLHILILINEGLLNIYEGRKKINDGSKKMKMGFRGFLEVLGGF